MVQDLARAMADSPTIMERINTMVPYVSLSLGGFKYVPSGWTYTHSVIHQCVSCPFWVHFCISALGRTRVPPHLGVLHQHVLARDPNVVQLQVSVIHLVEAELGADVTYNHACTHGGLNKSQLLQISYK